MINEKNKEKELIKKLNYTSIICPKCKSTETVPILYGREELIKLQPTFIEDEKNNKIILEKDIPHENEKNVPHNACRECNYKFSINEVLNG